MKKQWLRFTFSSFLVILMMVSLPTASYAADGGVEFPDWYSTSDIIMYFPRTATRYYKVQSNNLFVSNDLASFANFAARQWSGLINLQQVVDIDNEDGEVVQPSYDILITDIRRSNMDEDAPAGAIGYAVYTRTLERTTSYKYGYCYVYRLTSSSVYLIYDSETANYPFNKLRCAMTHELGHAIGYDGHDDRIETLMYFSDANYDDYGIYTPQARDIAHLHNVYPYLTNALQEVQ